ncbi:uncharacterized protein LOC143845277 isoform X2 [Paroedura picta]|uniref:uncharacterized protein LOC143845277 isoform X2 n=1 Tax=Paroedura picta TaxID=143630 RepID=UPI004055A011
MRPQHRFLALAAALVLLLAIVLADEPSVPAKSEASGESEMAPPLEQLTTGMPPVSFAGEERSHTDDVNGGLLNSDTASLGSFSLEPLPGESQSGPSAETQSQSHESQESVDHDAESEESLASQGM